MNDDKISGQDHLVIFQCECGRYKLAADWAKWRRWKPGQKEAAKYCLVIDAKCPKCGGKK